MSLWDRHSLADETEQLRLRPHQRCVAKVDLPRVPAGTEGTVTQVNGFAWLRYRVRFDNGEELTFLDARHLAAAS